MRAGLSLLTMILEVLRVVELALRARDGRGRGDASRDRRWGEAMRAELSRLAPLVGSAAPDLVLTRLIANAGASNGRILLNPAWIDDTAGQLCANDDPCRGGLVRGLAAHELSHHVRARTGAPRPAHVEELTADAWAGYLLARTGGEPRAYLALVGSGPSGGSVTHPPPDLRVAATLAGARLGARDCCAGAASCPACASPR